MLEHATRTQPDQALSLEIAETLDRIAIVGAGIARRIARGGLDGKLSGVVGTNADGDSQKALDLIADEAFRTAMIGSPVRFYASEEQEDVIALNPAGSLGLAIDPLDGSSNIETNVSIGTIFGIYPAADSAAASFLRPGRELLAAGYIIYGPQCLMVSATAEGVRKAVLDPATGAVAVLKRDCRIPDASVEYAINASNYRHWPAPIRAYIDDMVAGADGPRAQNFNMRWIASLVAEAHRIMVRGGVFLYPRDGRPQYAQGRLRLVYECAPIAWLIEAAGGAATDGCDRILDLVPTSLHQRTPFVFGSREKVARVATYHDLDATETSALFAKRGLFRI
ncbi:class 1 fructose-bisphosphatase [Paracoccus sp. Z118]|uniref:class 1 fructose-bisphosphatase n=1 Tax=Paracoccus sp. Z118 TaxID=2851017 RepID=UPI001C2B9FD5|nr:class 1 fructose-bisphosphatase [Paracoccus sp. Z118]MBV0892579.1 class 1 fructose-bisphosphatase [Paracoccus sp. Z118]